MTLVKDSAVWNASRPIRPVIFFMSGLLSLQAAWLLTVPSFRGIDEIDHAYRAASVVRGDLAASSQPVTDGRGMMVMVPPTLVESAGPACSQLKYVGKGNCEAVTNVQPTGLVGIASAASSYLPLYYAATGWPSLVLNGESALYGMRIVSMVLCDLILLLAAATAMRRRSAWHMAGLMVCLTPAFVYATVTAAPNGLSMAGGLLMWAAWTSLDRESTEHSNRRLLWTGALGAVVTIVTHNTGPIWVLMTMLIVAAIHGRWLWHNTGTRAIAAVSSCIFVAAALTLAWTRYSGANSLDGEWHAPTGGPPVQEVAMLPVRWLFQSVFGAPRPGGMTTGLVYGLAFTLLFMFCMAGWRQANAGVRRAMLLIVFVLTVLPLLLTMITYDDLGFAWQGRYSIPLGVGVTMLAAAELQRSRVFRPPLLLAALALGAVHVGAVVSARTNVGEEGAQFLTPGWVPLVLCVAAVASWWICLQSQSAVRTHPAVALSSSRDSRATRA